MKLALGAQIAAAIALSLVVAPQASAREEIGNLCVADSSEVDWTLVGHSRGLPPSPYQPRSGLPGVITQWETRVGPGLGPLAQQLVVFRQTGEMQYGKLAESSLETVSEGHNRFASRIPVPDFIEIGLHGPEETLFCGSEEGALSARWSKVTGPLVSPARMNSWTWPRRWP